MVQKGNSSIRIDSDYTEIGKINVKNVNDKSFKYWKFGTINIRSGKQKDEGAKIYSITKQVAKLNLSFCCLQELKYRNTGKQLITLDSGEKYEFHWCGMRKRREAGVGMLIKIDKEIVVKDPDLEDPLIIAIDMKVYGFNVRVVNVYAPTESGGSELQKDSFYKSLKKACVKNEKHQKLLVVGDFNAKTAAALQKCDYDGTQIIQDDVCNGNGARMKNFCRNYRMCIASSFFDYPSENRYTWYSCDNRTKRVNDYVLAEKFIIQYISACRAEPDLDFDSDHRVLITELTTPKTRKARWKKREIRHAPRLDTKKLRDTYVRDNFKTRLGDKLLNATLTGESTDETSQAIIYTLNTVAEATIPKVSKTITVETWKDDAELNSLLNDRHAYIMRSEEHRQLTKKIKKRVKHLRNERLQREAEEMNEFANRRKIEELYKKMKADDAPFKNLRSEKRCDPNKLKKHFQKHFNKDAISEEPPEITNAEFIRILQQIPKDTVNTEAPETTEILSSIKELKLGKSATDIPTDYIKVASENMQFVEEMARLYQTIWKTCQIPKAWGHSKLVAIWKGASKGRSEDPNAYRALQIGSSLCKLLIVIIVKRLKVWYELQLLEQQQGFRSGRGTTDGIYIIKRIHQISDQMKRPVYTLFIDLTAAFDHVPRKWMFKVLKKRVPDTCSKKLVNLMEELYSHTTTALAEDPNNVFLLSNGVRQGGPESPMLFNLYIDFVMRLFLTRCDELGIKFLTLKYCIPESATHMNRSRVGYQKVDWVGYADDLVLSFETEVDLQRALGLLDDIFTRFSLAINISKTKTMVLNHQYVGNSYPATICSLNGQEIENVTSFQYLGCCSKFDEPSTGNAEIEMRIDSSECTLYHYSKKFFNHKIAIKTRVRLLNLLVRSRLAYGCQTWSLTRQLVQRMRSTYTNMLRKMVKGGFRRKKDSWSFTLTNADILRLCGTEDIESYIRRQQRNYLAHLIRHDDTSISKRLTFSDNPRRPGRHITMKTMVLDNERMTEDAFNKHALLRKF